MEITLNVEVECIEGKIGRSTYLIVNPISQEVTHLVVRSNKRPHAERLIPIKWVKTSSHNGITVGCTYAEWEAMEPFYEVEFNKIEMPHYNNEGFGWPYVTTTYTIEYEPVTHKHIPVHTRELRRGTPVEATNGHIGRIDELLIDPQNKHLTHIVMSKGHLWGEKDIVIPISAVKEIADDRITLNLSKEEIVALPTVPLHRHSTSVVA